MTSDSYPSNINELSLREKEHRYHEVIISVDLGKSQDPTTYTIGDAIPVVEQTLSGKRVEVMHLSIDEIMPLPLGTDYADIPGIIRRLYLDERNWLRDMKSGDPLPPTLIIDEGGVGAPMCDMIVRQMNLRPVRYQLTAGTSRIHRLSRKHRRWTVPRTHVMNLLKAAVEFTRLDVDPRLKHAPTLVDEMKRIEFKENVETGDIKVVHRSGAHDDKTICAAAAYWWATFPGRRTGSQSTRFITDPLEAAALRGIPPADELRAQAQLAARREPSSPPRTAPSIRRSKGWRIR